MSENEVTNIAPSIRKPLPLIKLHQISSSNQWLSGTVYKLKRPGKKDNREDFTEFTRKAYVDLCHPYDEFNIAGWFELRPNVEELIRRHPSIDSEEKIEDAIRGAQFKFLFSAPGTLIVIDGIRLPSASKIEV